MNESCPTVSVVIPAHNAALFIEQALASVLNQTFADLEVIVSDDGSTDETPEIVRALAKSDPRVRLFVKPHEGLPGRTRNAGIEHARGEYLALLDADDLWTRSKLQAQMKLLRSRPSPGMTFTAAANFGPRDAPPDLALDAPAQDAHAPWISEPLSGDSGLGRLLARRAYICTSSVLMQRSVIETVGRFSDSPRLRCAEDTEFFARVCRTVEVSVLPEVCVFVRLHENKTSLRCPWTGLFEMMELAEQYGPLPKSVRRGAWSSAWVTRGEQMLRDREPGWRGAMLRSWSLAPGNLRRWPALIAGFLPAGAAQSFYGSLRARSVRKLNPLDPEA